MIFKKVIVIRHGKTHKEQLLKEEFEEKSKNIAKMISNQKNNKNIIFLSSPLDRCVESANMIIDKVNKLLNTKYKIILDDNLKSWNKNTETREESFERAEKYYKNIKHLDNPLIILISNSSIIPRLVFGLVSKKMSYSEYKNEILKKNKRLIYGATAIIKYQSKVKEYNI
jgi:hypothetical protein